MKRFAALLLACSMVFTSSPIYAFEDEIIVVEDEADILVPDIKDAVSENTDVEISIDSITSIEMDSVEEEVAEETTLQTELEETSEQETEAISETEVFEEETETEILEEETETEYETEVETEIEAVEEIVEYEEAEKLQASSGSCGTGVTWTFSSGTLTISGNGGMEPYYKDDTEDDEELDIYYPWDEEMLDFRDSIKKIVVEDGITGISPYAFWACENLTSVTIGKDVKSIDYYAFSSCDYLRTLVFDEESTLRKIGENAFESCWRLSTVKLPKTVETIEEYAFGDCSALKEIKLGKSLKYVGDYAFEYCENLKEIAFPKTLERIGIYVFDCCENLKTVKFRGKPPVFQRGEDPDDGFLGDTGNITGLYPRSKTEDWRTVINQRKTYGAESFKWEPFEEIEWSYENGLLTIISWSEEADEYESEEDQDWRDLQYSIDRVVIEENVEKIGDYAFAGCSSIREISFECPQIPISESAFNGIKAEAFVLDDATWSSFYNYGGNLYWRKWNIYGDGSLTIDVIAERYNLQESLMKEHEAPWEEFADEIKFIKMSEVTTAISGAWFAGCSQLEDTVIPNTIKWIGEKAYYGCSKLRNVNFQLNEVYEASTLPIMKNDVFGGDEATAYFYGTTAKTKSGMANYGSNMSWINWYVTSEGKKITLTIDGFGKINDFSEKLMDDGWYNVESDDNLVIPSWFESNEVYAGNSLKKVDIGQNITRIGARSFYNFRMETCKGIYIRGKVTELGEYALYQDERNEYQEIQIHIYEDMPSMSENLFGKFEDFNDMPAVNIPCFDIYYNADKNGWTDLENISFGNPLVSFIRTKEVEKIPDNEVWNVYHDEKTFAYQGKAESGYYLSIEDEEKLLRGLTDTQKEAIQYETFDWFRDNIIHRYNHFGEASVIKYVPFGGVCMALAETVALAHNGVISPLYTGSKIGEPISDDLKSRIVFHFLQQYLPENQDFEKEFQEKSQQEQLQILEQQLGNCRDFKNMVLIGVSWYNSSEIPGLTWYNPKKYFDDLGAMEPHAHALMAYGMEKGVFNVWSNGSLKQYNTRVVLYDPNFKTLRTELHETPWDSFYYNDGNAAKDPWTFAVPAYSCLSKNNNISKMDKQNNAAFTVVTNDNSFFQPISYTTGVKEFVNPNKNTYVTTDKGTFDLKVNGKTYNLQNGWVNGDNLGDDSVRVMIPMAAANSSTAELRIAVPADANIQISSNNAMDFAVHYQDVSFLKVSTTVGGTLEFKPDGAVKTELNSSGSVAMSVVSDNDNWEWSKVTTVAEDVTMLKTTMVEDGLIVDGDNLSSVTIYGEEGDNLSENGFTSDANNIFIDSTQDDISAFKDSDGDGVYDDSLNLHKHVYTKPVFNWMDDFKCTAYVQCAEDGCSSRKTGQCAVTSSTKNATCIADGVITYKASVQYGNSTFEDTKMEVLGKTGHTRGAYQLKTAATCTTAGVEVQKCNICGVELSSRPIAVKGHTWSNWKTVSAATVNAPEQQSRTCSVCKKSDSKTVGTKLAPSMKVNASDIKLKVKQKTSGLKITDLAAGDSVVSVASDNAKVVAVSGSKTNPTLAAGKKAGKANITILLASGYKKIIPVTVQKKAVTATAVKISATSLPLKKGASATIKAEVIPFTCTTKVKFSTSNKKIATVNSAGKITAKKPGKVKITAKCGSKKAVCNVIVE